MKMITNDITSYLHCRRCLKEIPQGESARSYARLEVGITPHGTVQIWCVRHDCHIAALMLDGELVIPSGSRARQ